MKKRNSFVALCEHASKNNWCWNIYCTTCGHSEFRIAFSKIIKGIHPDDKEFWLKGNNQKDLLLERKKYNTFWGNVRPEDQEKLALIVSEAKIEDIQKVAKMPDWLGYIGLTVHYCQFLMHLKLQPIEIISKSFLPQFAKLTKHDKALSKKLKEKQILTLEDLKEISNSLIVEN